MQTPPHYLFFKVNGSLLMLQDKEIFYIQAADDYVKVVTKDARHLASTTMKSLEENLPKPFCRIHRSYIINIHNIRYAKSDLVRIYEEEIPIQKEYLAEFLNRIRIY